MRRIADGAGADTAREAISQGGGVKVDAYAQGTIAFGFENEPVGSLPAYVRVEGAGSVAQIADAGTFGTIAPLVGSKYLYGAGSIRVGSPNGAPIQAFSLLFLPWPNIMAEDFYDVGGYRFAISDYSEARTITWRFDEPVSEISISGFSTRDQRQFLSAFAIDSVALEVLPEPSTKILATLGLVMLGVAGRLQGRARQDCDGASIAERRNGHSETVGI